MSRLSKSVVGSRSGNDHLKVFGLGLMLTLFFHAGVRFLAAPDSLLVRYCASHPVQFVETFLFFWAAAALCSKAFALRLQRAALAGQVLPAWSGAPVSVNEANTLMHCVDQLPSWYHGSFLVNRVRGALEFVQRRGTTDGLDEHLRAAADSDAEQVDGSYSLIRFITWAIPILGFLGTVIGITVAIANVTPEQITNSISGVTEGLAVAFDTTAVALAFSLCVMFFTFVMDRAECSALRSVDDYVQNQIANRFERWAPDNSGLADSYRRNTDLMLRATQQIVRGQAQLWAETIRDMQTRAERVGGEQLDQLAGTLTKVIDRTTQTHQEGLNAFERQSMDKTDGLLRHFDRVDGKLEKLVDGLENLSNRLAEQSQAVSHMLVGEQQVARLQESLNNNLQLLANANTLQQTIHSLTAAVHIMTAGHEHGKPALSVYSGTQQGNVA